MPAAFSVNVAAELIAFRFRALAAVPNLYGHSQFMADRKLTMRIVILTQDTPALCSNNYRQVSRSPAGRK